MRRLMFVLVLSVSVLAQQQNPPTVWCDYHNAAFLKGGQEFPSGVCYDIYRHTYYDQTCRCRREHRMTMKCAR